ncbi:MAG: glycosyltransferase family 4 protein [Actinobacteria bacterium]|nr:glycosyltransferase family 4 protein [Actinomycetota bacterium]
MRVGIDARGLGNINRWRGIGRYTARLVEALARKAEGEAELVLFGYGEGPSGDLLDAGTARQVEWVSVPQLERFSYAGMVAEHLLFARRVAASGVELFHGIDHNLSPFIPCPSLVTVHDLILLVLRGPYLGPTAWAWMRFHKASARRARFVVVVSENTARDVERIWGIPRERIAVVPEGVTPEYRPLEDREAVQDVIHRLGVREPYFLYLGGFDPRKNLRNLLLAFKLFLYSAGEDVLLVMAGDRRGFEGYLDDEVEELGLEGHVHFTGFVPERDLPALYGGATAFVCVSLYEGFGLPLLEAMACGTPVLASGVSSIPEVVGEAGLLVDPLDPEEIASGMRRLWEDAEARAELVSRGKERAASYTWDEAAARILELYRRIFS